MPSLYSLSTRDAHFPSARPFQSVQQPATAHTFHCYRELNLERKQLSARRALITCPSVVLSAKLLPSVSSLAQGLLLTVCVKSARLNPAHSQELVGRVQRKCFAGVCLNRNLPVCQTKCCVEGVWYQPASDGAEAGVWCNPVPIGNLLGFLPAQQPSKTDVSRVRDPGALEVPGPGTAHPTDCLQVRDPKIFRGPGQRSAFLGEFCKCWVFFCTCLAFIPVSIPIWSGPTLLGAVHTHSKEQPPFWKTLNQNRGAWQKMEERKHHLLPVASAGN